MTTADLTQDAVSRYEDAQARAQLARKAWAKAGRPLTITYPNGIEAPHPLWRMIEESDKLASRLGDAPVLRRAHRGPEPSAVVQADIGSSPAARLRAVR